MDAPSGIFEQCKQGVCDEITEEIREEGNDFIEDVGLQSPWYTTLHKRSEMGE